MAADKPQDLQGQPAAGDPGELMVWLQAEGQQAGGPGRASVFSQKAGKHQYPSSKTFRQEGFSHPRGESVFLLYSDLHLIG